MGSYHNNSRRAAYQAAKEAALTSEQLKRLLKYDTITGKWSALVSRGRWMKGKRVGSINRDGYLVIRIGTLTYMAHRLAHLYVLGTWPECVMDHRNRKRSDCRWDNIRPSTHFQNQGNRNKPKSNRSGHVGVSWNNTKKKWYAHIRRDGKSTHLGCFNNINDAAERYKAAHVEIFGEYSPYA